MSFFSPINFFSSSIHFRFPSSRPSLLLEVGFMAGGVHGLRCCWRWGSRPSQVNSVVNTWCHDCAVLSSCISVTVSLPYKWNDSYNRAFFPISYILLDFMVFKLYKHSLALTYKDKSGPIITKGFCYCYI